MVNTKQNSFGNRTGSLAESCFTSDGESISMAARAPGPSFKPQDNNASFEGISEAEYNKRHMKALKDADPGLKLQASSTKLRKHQAASFKPQAASFKRQAASFKLHDS